MQRTRTPLSMLSSMRMHIEAFRTVRPTLPQKIWLHSLHSRNRKNGQVCSRLSGALSRNGVRVRTHVLDLCRCASNALAANGVSLSGVPSRSTALSAILRPVLSRIATSNPKGGSFLACVGRRYEIPVVEERFAIVGTDGKESTENVNSNICERSILKHVRLCHCYKHDHHLHPTLCKRARPWYVPAEGYCDRRLRIPCNFSNYGSI